MKRLEKFESLMNSAWYKKLFLKLKKSEQELLLKILNENSHLTEGEFRKLTRSIFVDNKTKNWLIIEEIITICNDSCSQ